MTTIEPMDALRLEVLLRALKDTAKGGKVSLLPLFMARRHVQQRVKKPIDVIVASAMSDDSSPIPGIAELLPLVKEMNHNEFNSLVDEIKGGPGSGNWRHGGTPGRGGSPPTVSSGSRGSVSGGMSRKQQGLTLSESGFQVAVSDDPPRAPSGTNRKVMATIEQEVERTRESFIREDGSEGIRQRVIARVRNKVPIDEETVNEVYAQSTRGNNAIFWQLMGQLTGEKDEGFDEPTMNTAYMDRMLSADIHNGDTGYIPIDVGQDAMPALSSFAQSRMEPRDTFAMPVPRLADGSMHDRNSYLPTSLGSNVVLSSKVAPMIGEGRIITHQPSGMLQAPRDALLQLGSGQ